MKNKELTSSQMDLLKSLLKEECKMTLDDEVMSEFLRLGEVVSLKKGESVCAYGSVDKNIYILISGIVARWIWNGEKEEVAGFVMPGTMFVEYHSYYFDKPSHSSFEACVPSELLCIPADSFNAMVIRNHEFCRWALSMAQCQLYFYEMKERVINGSVKEQYEILLNKRPEILSRVPLKTIAAYLKISVRYLTMLRKNLVVKK